MKKFFKYFALLSLAAAAILLLATDDIEAAVGEAWNHWVINARAPSTFGGHSTGTPEKLGQVTVESTSATRKGLVVKMAASATANPFDVVDSSGSSVASIDKDGDLVATTVTSTGANSFASATFSGMVTINDNLLVDGDGTADVQFRVDGTSGQTADLAVINSNNGSNVEQFSLDADGDAEFSNSVLIDGADAADEQLKVQAHASQSANVADFEDSSGTSFVAIDASGDLVCSQGLVLSNQGTDPCASLPNGALFYNSASNILCYCNHNAVDLKIDGSSASCF